MTIKHHISIQYRCDYSYVENDPRLPREKLDSIYTRNYYSFRAFIEGVSKYQTDSIYCIGGLKEQVLRLIDEDPENPFKNAVFESHYESHTGQSRNSTRYIEAESYKEAYEKFCALKTEFVIWANQKYKQYGVNLSLYNDNDKNSDLEKNLAEVRNAMAEIAKQKADEKSKAVSEKVLGFYKPASVTSSTAAASQPMQPTGGGTAAVGQSSTPASGSTSKAITVVSPVRNFGNFKG